MGYDVAGRLVRDLVNGRMTPGFRKQVPWNGQDNSGTQVSTGVYLYRFTAGDFAATRKLIVMK